MKSLRCAVLIASLSSASQILGENLSGILDRGTPHIGDESAIDSVRAVDTDDHVIAIVDETLSAQAAPLFFGYLNEWIGTNELWLDSAYDEWFSSTAGED